MRCLSCLATMVGLWSTEVNDIKCSVQKCEYMKTCSKPRLILCGHFAEMLAYS